MNLGPYVILDQQNIPSHWCYISLNNKNEVMYHTKSYFIDEDWQEKSMQEGLLYVYCPKANSPLCYAYKDNILYQLPLAHLAGQTIMNEDYKVYWDIIVNRVYKLNSHNNEIKFALVDPHSLEIKVDKACYHKPPQNLNKPPDLPGKVQSALSMPTIQTKSTVDEASHEMLHRTEVIMKLLYEAGLLTGEQAQANFEAVLNHNNREQVIFALRQLNEFGTLKKSEDPQITFVNVLKRPFLEEFAIAIQRLNDTKLRNYLVEILQDLFSYNKEGLYKALFQLDNVGLLDVDQALENFQAVLKHDNPQGLAAALRALCFVHSSYTRDNFQAVKDKFEDVLKHDNPQGLAAALNTLSAANEDLLKCKNPKTIIPNFEGLSKCKNINALADALEECRKIGLFMSVTQQSVQIIDYYSSILYDEPKKLTDAFEELYSTRNFHNIPILTSNTKDHFEAVLKHNNPQGLAEALKEFREAYLLSGMLIKLGNIRVHFEAVLKHNNPQGLAEALKEFREAYLLSGVLIKSSNIKVYFEAVLKHDNPQGLAKALKACREAGLHTGEQAQANFEAVLKHNNPQGLAEALKEFREAYLLSGMLIKLSNIKVYFEAVLKHDNPQGLAKALKACREAGLHTGEQAQANFEAVVKHENPQCCPLCQASCHP